jgi:POT family proton-dependent oligopeptide transporter
MVALGWILLVVVFFWMSFHQNGLTMTFFARDYTVQQVDRLNYLLFDVRSVIALATAAGGLVLLLRRRLRPVLRLAGGALISGGGLALVWQYHRFEPMMTLDPEIFQQFNPIFVVACTPLVVGLFSYLNKRGKEPSAPRKIGIGMLLSAVSFLVLLFCSIGLPAPGELDAAGSPDRVSPYWLFWSYFIITWGELFLNPMGISFVSRIAPARFRGLSQGLWLCSIAVGNQLLFVGSSLWERLELWQVWFIFVACCLLSATILFALSRKFERYTA